MAAGFLLEAAAAAALGGPRAGGLGSCTKNSFTPETKVLLADGTTKSIKDVRVGDKVLATDPKTGKTYAKTVTPEIKGQGAKKLVKVTIDTDGKKGTKTASVTATDGHPFWVPELNEWITATALKPGQWLRTSAGTHVQITAVARWTQQATVYNLTVADVHTYYVLARATPVLVHNSTCPAFRTGKPISGPIPDAGQTSLYALVNPKNGELLKWGISKNPAGRYKSSDYDGGTRMVILRNYDSRRDALDVERYMTERHPGPLNFEPHRGSVSPSRSWEQDLRYVTGGGFFRDRDGG
ncbi:Hint domain-containing protein [Streptomyces sp. NPDC057137]|uniref:Hint domain-containing protein n=1 Tax=Streptomyces sp. NPDC057137 TaxID=3346030 RepID=UPI00363FA1C9